MRPESVRAWNPKRSLGIRVRRLVEAAVVQRFDEVVHRLDIQVELLAEWRGLVTDLTRRIVAVQAGLGESRLEIDALRQQLEECLDFLRVQHEVGRDALAYGKANAEALQELRERYKI